MPKPHTKEELRELARILADLCLRGEVDIASFHMEGARLRGSDLKDLSDLTTLALFSSLSGEEDVDGLQAK